LISNCIFPKRDRNDEARMTLDRSLPFFANRIAAFAA
jgi:hypothetical protein